MFDNHNVARINADLFQVLALYLGEIRLITVALFSFLNFFLAILIFFQIVFNLYFCRVVYAFVDQGAALIPVSAEQRVLAVGVCFPRQNWFFTLSEAQLTATTL